MRLRLLLLCLTVVALLAPSGGDESHRPAEVPVGQPQLIAYDPLPASCAWPQAEEALQAFRRLVSPAVEAAALLPAPDGDRAPLRRLADLRPTWTSVAVDPARNTVALYDTALFQILEYDRRTNTPPEADATQPLRVIAGVKARIGFNSSLHLDQQSGDIYAVNNDVIDTLTVFSPEASGNVAPERALDTPHGTWGIAVDDRRQELFLTVQHDAAVVVYRKQASGDESPIRLLQGDRTRLADPHGIAVDVGRDLMFVANQGYVHRVDPQADARGRRRRTPQNWPLDRNFAVVGSGEFRSPSIVVHRRDASGNAAPVAVIEGARTQLNWPTTVKLHPERGELFVANDGGNSVLVFGVTDNGNVAPRRVLKGPKTHIRNPTGLAIDFQNDELWVSSIANHTATAFPIAAEGDTPPLRLIRSAPLGKLALAFTNPSGVGYDSKRSEILVPS